MGKDRWAPDIANGKQRSLEWTFSRVPKEAKLAQPGPTMEEVNEENEHMRKQKNFKLKLNEFVEFGKTGGRPRKTPEQKLRDAKTTKKL